MANLGGKHWNAVEDRILKKVKHLEDMLYERVMADGEPYGTEVVSGRELYDQLIQMRATGDPAYYEDPAAAAALAKLSEQYGPPPASVAPYSSPFEPAGVM